MERKEKSRLENLAIILSVIAGFFILILLIFIWKTNDVEVKTSRSNKRYARINDCSIREIEKEEAPIGVIIQYRFSMDQMLESDTYLAFYTVHQYVDVYIDGEHIYSLQPSKRNRMIKTVGCNWVMLPIYREDIGKEILVEITPVYESVHGREVEFLMGSELSIYKERFMKDLPQLLLSAVIIFTGIVILCCAAYSLNKNETSMGLGNLGLAAVIVGCWRLTDTRFTPLLYDHQSILLYYISITMLMLGTLCLVQLRKMQCKTERKNIYNFFDIGTSLIYIVQVMLQIFGIMDLRECLFVTHVLLLFGIIMIIVETAFEYSSYDKKKGSYSNEIIFFIILAGILTDVSIYYIRKTSSGLLFTMLSFLCYILLKVTQIISYVNTQKKVLLEQEKILIENEKQIRESQIISMEGQIKAHFVFNVLNAISGMCKYNPQKADETIVRFARYLRTNINIFQDDRSVLFCEAMRHLEDYIGLQQVRFGDKIRFEKKIDVDNFKIPSLILQPLVENSIKHGIMPKKEGGTIVLSTWREEKNIFICIEDDGVGFDTSDHMRKEGVGLKNIRFRLEYIVKGELEVNSTLGEGTVAIIRIPVEEVSKCM